MKLRETSSFTGKVGREWGENSGGLKKGGISWQGKNG